MINEQNSEPRFLKLWLVNKMVKQSVDQWTYSSHLRLALDSDLNDSDFDWWLKIGDAFRISLRSDSASLFFDCSIPATVAPALGSRKRRAALHRVTPAWPIQKQFLFIIIFFTNIKYPKWIRTVKLWIPIGSIFTYAIIPHVIDHNNIFQFHSHHYYYNT